MTLDITGLDNAYGFPVGATLTATSWHVAELYGPGVAHDTEADAIAAGIEALEARIAKHREFHGAYWAEHAPHPENLSIDLRWYMKWEQGTFDANGRRTFSCGQEFTVRRVTYKTLAEARDHLDRIRKYRGVGV